MRARLLLVFLVASLLSLPAMAGDYEVRITLKPRGLVWGELGVPVTVGSRVARTDLLINGVPFASGDGRSMVFRVPVGKYLRRMRVRAVGYDATGRILGVDEMTVNDPQPPFRLRLSGPPHLPEKGTVSLHASVTSPPNVPVEAVDFLVGETVIGRDAEAPYEASFDAKLFPGAPYARAVARARGSLQANDVLFWEGELHEQIEVVVKHLPMSAFGREEERLTLGDLTLLDNGTPRPLEALVAAQDQPLNVIMLIDSSESMLDGLPIIQEAAKQFARTVIRPSDRIAVVGFHQQVFWLTGFTSDIGAVDRAVGKLRPRGQTHLYDAVIEMLYELQKMPGRKALVVLTDGMNQGGEFALDHLVHYARYSGVPVYPIVRNPALSRLMRFGLGGRVRKFAQIARDSGASYFVVQRTSELPGVYSAIARELKHQYVLVFRTESTGSDVWHPIAVTTKKKMQLRVPKGYFP